jgi:hypothetical protein
MGWFCFVARSTPTKEYCAVAAFNRLLGPIVLQACDDPEGAVLAALGSQMLKSPVIQHSGNVMQPISMLT